MVEYSQNILKLEKEHQDKSQEEEDLNLELEEAHQIAKDSKKELNESRDNEQLKEAFKKAKEERNATQAKIKKWKKENAEAIASSKKQCTNFQRHLKTLCAAVRNEYSKSRLQEDFRQGLLEMYHREREDEGNEQSATEQQQLALPPDYKMDVFCISSNDYLKLIGVKPKSDGPPNTFIDPNDTQIPMLRVFCYQLTSRNSAFFIKNYVETANYLLDRVRLVSQNANNIPSGRLSIQLKNIFEHQTNLAFKEICSIALKFKMEFETKVRCILLPSLATGANLGQAAAMRTVNSWGSKHRRSRNEPRDIQKNGTKL